MLRFRPPRSILAISQDLTDAPCDHLGIRLKLLIPMVLCWCCPNPSGRRKALTIEERFERIEHITAGLAEERRQDREEYKTLWRDTERQIRELAIHIDEVDARLGNRIEQFAVESRAADARLREANDRLRERIDALVSGIGQLLAGGTK
jgi:hypothetical protein